MSPLLARRVLFWGSPLCERHRHAAAGPVETPEVVVMGAECEGMPGERDLTFPTLRLQWGSVLLQGHRGHQGDASHGMMCWIPGLHRWPGAHSHQTQGLSCVLEPVHPLAAPVSSLALCPGEPAEPWPASVRAVHAACHALPVPAGEAPVVMICSPHSGAGAVLLGADLLRPRLVPPVLRGLLSLFLLPVCMLSHLLSPAPPAPQGALEIPHVEGQE